MTVPDPAALLALTLFVVGGGCLVGWFGLKERVVAPTLTAYGLHLVVAAVMYALWGLWAPDAMLYDRLGVGFAEVWAGQAQQYPGVTAGKEGLPIVLAVLYTVFGHVPLLGVLFNITLASLTVPVVASTARTLKLPMETAAWFAALFPAFLLWGSVLLRESASWLLLALVVRGLAGLAEEAADQMVRNWFLVLAPLALLVTVRGTAAILVAAAALFTFSISARNKTVPILIGLLALGAAGPFLLSTGSEIAGGYDVEAINRQRAALSRTASTSFEVESYSSLGDMILSAPVATLRGLFGPFPWELPSLGTFLIVDTLLWWFLVACCILGWRSVADKRGLWSMLVPALTMLVVLSTTSGNYGTMTRLRDQAAIMVIPLAAAGLAVMRENSRPDVVGRRLKRPTVPGLR